MSILKWMWGELFWTAHASMVLRARGIPAGKWQQGVLGKMNLSCLEIKEKYSCPHFLLLSSKHSCNRDLNIGEISVNGVWLTAGTSVLILVWFSVTHTQKGTLVTKSFGKPQRVIFISFSSPWQVDVTFPQRNNGSVCLENSSRLFWCFLSSCKRCCFNKK